MGAPDVEGGNEIDKIGKNLEYAGRDIGTGITQIARGDVSKGAKNLAAGYSTALTYGIDTPLTIRGQARTEAAASAAAKDRALTAEAADMAKETDRRGRIATRLKEEIRLRQKQPGREQTLLTSTLTPNSQFTGTLLTGASKR